MWRTQAHTLRSGRTAPTCGCASTLLSIEGARTHTEPQAHLRLVKIEAGGRCPMPWRRWGCVSTGTSRAYGHRHRGRDITRPRSSSRTLTLSVQYCRRRVTAARRGHRHRARFVTKSRPPVGSLLHLAPPQHAKLQASVMKLALTIQRAIEADQEATLSLRGRLDLARAVASTIERF